jgi:serine/threonine protein kinase
MIPGFRRPAAETPVTLASGTTFGPYKILEPLGRGGMASVYRAYEPGLDRHVALKVLPAEFLHDEGFAERFRREAKVIARLEHPHIIPIHNFGIEEQSRTPWMAMRLVAGGALSGAMKKARMPPERVVALLRGVAEALDYAHGKGVVHRDIKPQNILLDEAGRVYLADFGIAKMLEGSPGLTQTGMITGTPQYMAPEQAMATAVDHRADIYALGIVAYEMLTGRVPFAADTPVAVLMKQVQDPIPIPSPGEVPEPLVRVLLKALAKRPDERWPTASAFVKELGDALGQASTVGAVSPVAPTSSLPATYPTTVHPAGHSTAPPSAVPSAALGRGPVIAIVAGVVVAGILTTAALLVVLRPTSTDPGPRPPVVLRSPLAAEAAVNRPPLPTATAPHEVPESETVTPSATVPPPVRRSAPTAPTSRVTPPPLVTEHTGGPPHISPPTLPPAPAPATAGATAVSPAFATAGTVEAGDAFYEKTLSFAEDRPLPFEGHVGPLKVESVRFTVAEKKKFGSIDDLRAELRAAFQVECPKGAGAWDYKMQVEILDENGRRLDRFGDDGRCKDEVKMVAANRGILKALVSAARGVKIRFEASRR